ncbi:ABC transporter permease [Occultella gossypii]|uniref:ABC transporter permease n=1 Tax=Occultella gossypii TaxID=2800820 RepID=A0ABS7SB07_9MICO|nr:ABC transporter permease [Occultella gossypii]MBZ2196915.1 ABC transporter permease [Occultella gossypii]
MFAIAYGELVQILRNRAVLITSLLMPVAVSIFIINLRDTFARIGSLGYVGAVLVFTIAAFTLYATTVTSLAARRQDRFLKRLRSTAASDPTILSGLVAPVTGISLLQIAVILSVFAGIGGAAVQVALLVAGVVASFAMMLALGIATAGITKSPEHAQVTALPLSLGVIAVASWVGITGTESLAPLERLLPGGAATELMVNAWNGDVPVTESLLLLLPTLAWVIAAVALASRMFRWEPRR